MDDTSLPAACRHPRTTLCHGALRWACEDCGHVALREGPERRQRLEDRLAAVRSGRVHDRRSSAA